MESNSFKNEPMQLLNVNENGLIDITTEATDYLNSLKKEKLCILSIIGPRNSGKSKLLNSFLKTDNNGFNISETKGLWIWGKPVELENNKKLLILDCQALENDDVSLRLFLICELLSTYIIYNTKGEINDNLINDFFKYLDVSKTINIYSQGNKKNTITNLSNYLPDLLWIMNEYENKEISSDNYLENIIKNNNKISENFTKLYKNYKCFYLKDSNDENQIDLIFNYIKSNSSYKKINNIDIDGIDLFGILTNYLDSMENGEIPIINNALENILLSKAKNINENLFEEFVLEFQKKIDKFPKSFKLIYNIFFELQDKYSELFCNKVKDLFLTSEQTGKYLINLYQRMKEELENVFEKNNEFYNEWFDLEFKEMEEILNNENNYKINNLDQIKNIFNLYSNSFELCFKKFNNIPKDNFSNNLILVMLKIFEDFVKNKLNLFAENINEIYENYNKENLNKIENLQNNLNLLTEQLNNNKKLLEDKNNEKNEININLLELENKIEQLKRENKTKEKEYLNNIEIEKQKLQNTENFYNNNLKEKNNKIEELEKKIEKLNVENSAINKDNINKINELNREILKLNNEIEHLSEEQRKKNDFGEVEKNLNLHSLFKNIQNTFMEFKKSIDKIEDENENLFKTKEMNLSVNEIENNMKNWINEIKNYKENQFKNLNENYEKNIKSIKNDLDETNLKLTKKESEFNNQIEISENFKSQFNEANLKVNQLNEITKSKDNLINTQNDTIKMYEDKIKDFNNDKDKLEMLLNSNIVNFKMKEDEVETILMVIECMLAKNKNKYEHNLNKLSNECKASINNMVKKYKLFK